MIVLAAVAWAVMSTSLGIAAALGWHRTACENRRLKGWIKHWRQQAETMAGALARSHSASARGSHARAAQVDQARARIRATAARLEAGK